MQRPNVLLVDDEESIRKAVGQLLLEHGYQVAVCTDGVEALDYLGTSRPDVIVSDVRMPKMDGIELLDRIRADARLVDIPVILLTAKGLVQDRIAGYDAGADAYIPKPFDPEELLVLIDNVAKKNKEATREIDINELKNDLDEIKQLLASGGAGPGEGYVQATEVFLPPDERKLLELLCEGLMNKEIAARMYLSTRRVEALLTSLYRKTGTKNRTELLRWAISTGYVDL